MSENELVESLKNSEAIFQSDQAAIHVRTEGNNVLIEGKPIKNEHIRKHSDSWKPGWYR